MTKEKWESAIKEEEVELCLQWIALQKIVKTPNKRLKSYFMKHLIQSYYDKYISEASFVEAVKRSGINYKEWDPYSRVREPDGTLSRRSYGIIVPFSIHTVRFYRNKEKTAI